MQNAQIPQYILGIDLGTNSVGWAVVGLIDGEPAGLTRAGVRVFDAGMDDTRGPGREESRNKARRDARLQRRQTWRRARRLKKIFNLLQRLGLLPPDPAPTPEVRQELLNELDQKILNSQWFATKRASGKFPEPEQTMPYILRAAALDELMEPHFLGRALYHLAQRRGFLSNRKAARKAGEDEGAVKDGIAQLRKEVAESKSRTLGDHLARQSPSVARIRRRWTARDMYESEFDTIWAVQARHHPNTLTEPNRKQLRQAVFFQRPLWVDPNSVGRCELEPRWRRAPAYLLSSQRFRLLQAVNNLKVVSPGDVESTLTPADRKQLVDALELEGDLRFARIRKLLRLDREHGFNLERGGEERMVGNRTNAAFQAALGARWLAMPLDQRRALVEYVHSFENADKLRDAAAKKWNFDDGTAGKLSEISLEPDYLNVSRCAIQKLLPLLEDGLPYGEARKAAYPESFEATASQPSLPPVTEALPEIRNPAVMRSLTELRKVVNAAVRRFGKPVQIRIELARDLKKSKKQRLAIADANRRNEAARTQATKEIIGKAGVAQPRRDDIRRHLLAEECGWICPYTGRPIPMGALFGPEPQFDIEHIIPFSRSMDDSFQNLTLCFVQENRDAKGNRTPYEAYAGDQARYEAILERVKRLSGDRATVAAKLKRFKMNDEELTAFLDDFRNRQLNDTAYASRLAARYLGILYGGVNDAHGNKCIQATSGQATGYFRALWQLNSILNDGPTSSGGHVQKSRDDHRHHAIDAVVIGLTDAAMVKRLADAAQRAAAEHRRRFASLQAPWPNFTDSIRSEVGRITASHRVSKKIRGALHEETIYSPLKADGLPHVRKPLPALTKSEADEIVDPTVREMVQEKLRENGGDPKKAFAAEANLPCFHTRDGREIPIKCVRIKKAVPTFPLGTRGPARHVISESNHHVEIWAELGTGGNEGRWRGEVVPMHEAYRRARAGEPVIRRDHGPQTGFKFSLAPGETVECDGPCGTRSLWAVRGATSQAGSPRLFLVPINDARKKADILKAALYWRPFLSILMKLNARKVHVNPLGELGEAHD